MRKILCATDETEVSRKAERYAATLAKALNAELRFLHVNPVTQEDLQSISALDVTILEEIEARNHQILQHAHKVAQEHGLSQAYCVIIGGHDIADTVVEFAEQERFDHIITGSTGRSGIPRFLYGSVAREITQKAHCPVTVVR